MSKWMHSVSARSCLAEAAEHAIAAGLSREAFIRMADGWFDLMQEKADRPEASPSAGKDENR